ncbi:hypothetical protein ACHAXT_003673 [Thalassiosira profunda]
MAFRPLTYAGQYPPLAPRSPADVSTYAGLHASLRALPELSKEGDKILNEEMLARLVDGVRRFQRDQLGRNSKSKYWPAVRLPDPLFADRAGYPNGPLSVAILSAFRIKRSAPWRNFNFDNPKLFDDNVAIIKKMEQDLVDRGFLKRPVIYFDASVAEGLGESEVQRLGKIAQRFGAKVVDDPAEVANGRVSHIVAYDGEEHDKKDVIAEEERREREHLESEKTYLKTLAIVDVPVADIEPGNTSGNARKMALVHWWYHPSSYDEWMAAEEVAGEVEVDDHPGIPGGPAVVGCKFIRDVERFNEWGVEADYAVMEYERKLAYLRKAPAKAPAKSSKKAGKSGKRRSNRSAAKEEPADDLSTASEGEPASKRAKLDRQESLLGAAPPSPSRKYGRKSSRGGSPASKPAVAVHVKPARQTADRRKPSEGGNGGMNPRRILTGFRGPRGELDRRTVYDGALRVEGAAYSVVRDALEDYLLGNGTAEKGTTSPALGARQEWRKLLPPTGFVRPCADTSLNSVTVTELTLKEVEVLVPSIDGISEPTRELRDATVAVHVSVPVLTPEEEEVAAAGEEGPASIRGGGEEGGATPGAEADAPAAQPQATVEPVAAAATEPTVNEEIVAQPSASEGVVNAPGTTPGDAETAEVAATEAANVGAVQPGLEAEAGTLPSAAGDVQETAPPVVDSKPNQAPESSAPTAAATAPQDTEPMAVDTPADEGKASSEVPIESMAPESVAPAVAPAEAGGSAPVAPAAEDVAMEEPSAASAPASDAVASAEEVAAPAPEAMGAAVSVPAEAVPATSADANVEHIASEPTSDAAPSEVVATSAAPAPEAPVTAPVTAPTEVKIESNVEAATAQQPSSAPELAAIASSGATQPTPGQVVPLPPGTQLSNSLYRPAPAPSAEEAKTVHLVLPSWYDASEPSDFEKRTLPEWFNDTAPHRTPASYIDAREKILDIAKRNVGQYITTTAVRRSVLGDAGSLLRLHEFLVGQGLLNSDRVGETTPSDAVLRGLGATRKPAKKMRLQTELTTERMKILEAVLPSHARQKKDEAHPDQPIQIIVDWSGVAADVGGGVTAADCQRAFLEPPSEESRLAADASKGSVKSMLSGVIDGVRPEVLKATIDAALRTTEDVSEARKACVVALTASAAASEGVRTEAEVESTLMDILDRRVQRLENRVALLDDVEALLEAERVSLELERRDMYTTRCRHWFGDGSS